MRWERLFADLEAQFDAETRAADDADLAELVRAERARLTLADRLRGHLGAMLTWRFSPASGLDGPVEARLVDLGSDWFLLSAGHGAGRCLLVPAQSVSSMSGLARDALVDDSQVAKRMSLTVVLRGLARDRAGVRLSTSGEQLTGTIDRVGQDHVDLAVHDLGVARRFSQVREVRCVPLSAITMVALDDAPGTG